MQNDLFNFSISTKFIILNPQSKEISWQALLMATFLIQLSNLPSNIIQ